MSLALTKLSRPSLAILSEDFPKVKNVISKSEIDDLMNFLIRILNIKISTPEDEENMNFQMAMVLDLIRTKFGNLTIPEIKEAFKMYVARDFAELKVFRILDCACVGEVLTAFTNFRTDALRIHIDKQIRERNTVEIREEEKEKNFQEFLTMVFDEIQNKKISSSGWLLLPKLKDKIKIEVQVAKRLYRMQERQYLIELTNDVIKNKRKPHHVELLKEMQKRAADGKPSGVVQNKCRSIVVCHYLKNFKTFEEFKKAINDLD